MSTIVEAVPTRSGLGSMMTLRGHGCCGVVMAIGPGELLPLIAASTSTRAKKERM